MKKLIGVLILFAATLASADTLQLVSAPYGTPGPYNVSVNGGPATPLICFSGVNFITIGEQWTVQVFTIDTIGNIVGDFAGTVAQYNELGYLADQLFASPGNQAIQDAIWAVLGKGGAQNSFFTAAVNFINANPNYRTTDLFYIPVGDFSQLQYGEPQPFIGQTPEPASLLLFGSGLLGVFGILRRKATSL